MPLCWTPPPPPLPYDSIVLPHSQSLEHLHYFLRRHQSILSHSSPLGLDSLLSYTHTHTPCQPFHSLQLSPPRPATALSLSLYTLNITHTLFSLLNTLQSLHRTPSYSLSSIPLPINPSFQQPTHHHTLTPNLLLPSHSLVSLLPYNTQHQKNSHTTLTNHLIILSPPVSHQSSSLYNLTFTSSKPSQFFYVYNLC